MKDSVIVEVRSGEGGLDSKQLVDIQFGIYQKHCFRRCL